MKKALSLVLAIVMVLTCMSSMVFAVGRPVALDENATWLAVENTSKKATYVTKIDTNAAAWAASISGGVTFYLLKDATHPAEAVFPTTWVAANPVTLDLNGHTLTSTQNSQDFTLNGNGVLTIQNGTYKHSGSGAMIRLLSTATDTQKNAADTNVATVNFKNAFVMQAKASGFTYADLIIYSLYNNVVLNVDNSILWSNSDAFGCAMRFEQLVKVTMNINNSIVGDGGAAYGIFSQARPANTADTYVMNAVITAQNSLLLSSDGSLSRAYWRYNVNGFQWGNTDGTDFAPASPAGDVMNPKGVALTSWSFSAPGSVNLSSAKGWSFGTAPTSFTTAKTYGFVLDAAGNLAAKVEATAGKFVAPDGSWNTRYDGNGTAYAGGNEVPASSVLVPAPATSAANPANGSGAILAIVDGKSYTFPTFNTEVATWAAQQEGGANLYLLKDLELTSQVIFPLDWLAENPVTLDLNSYTLSCTGNYCPIIVNGNGEFTLQGGTYVVSGGAQNICIGSNWPSRVDAAGIAKKAILNLKDVAVLNTSTADNATVIHSSYCYMDLNLDNAIVWAAHDNFRATIRFENRHTINVNINNSIVGNNGANATAIISCADDASIPDNYTSNIVYTVTNSAMISSDGSFQRGGYRHKINNFQWGYAESYPNDYVTNAGGTAVTNYKFTIPDGTEITGVKGTTFGTAPTAISIWGNVILVAEDGTIDAFTSLQVGDEYILPATSNGAKWNTKPDGSGVVYKEGDKVGPGLVLYPVDAKFVYTLDADYHMCTIQCAVCGKCLDADCDKDVCADKCMLATLKLDDVKVGHWYKDAVEYVYHAGIMDGTSKTTFGANNDASRVAVISALWNIAGKPTTVNSIRFTDVKAGQWYTEAVRWAAGYGITTGGSDGLFNGDGDVTREQLAAFLFRFAKYMNLNTTVSADLTAFSDANTVSEYAVDAMEWAVGVGVINGKDNGKLDPTGVATRAELAKMLMVVSSL
ncbi:MAG: S-layer homology domain-containing protein [Oscillospiraceae bacterium]|nr:S-layer homology domain-containing protein [Oscillospiraceae bacterium]